jgi:hypothetical protein
VIKELEDKLQFYIKQIEDGRHEYEIDQNRIQTKLAMLEWVLEDED